MAEKQRPNLTPDDFDRHGLLPPLCLPLPVPYGPDPASLRVEGAREPGRSWAVAAAALAAGEPRRALAALEALASADLSPASAAATVALRTAAQALEIGHCPGGWSDVPRDSPRLMEFASLQLRGGEALADAPAGGPWLLTFLAGSLLPQLLSVQHSTGQAADAVIRHERLVDQAEADPAFKDLLDDLAQAAPSTEGRDIVQLSEDILLDRLGRFGAPDPQHPLLASVHGALRLFLAGVCHWAGAPEQAEEHCRAALGADPGDFALRGWATMISGDRAMGLPAAAEQRRPAADLPPTADLDSADRLWAESAQLYHQACCNRGEAAALLRRAHLARLRGRVADRREFLREAETLAARAGDGALRSLVRVHDWLDQVEDGTYVPDSVCASVREWGVTYGGTGWLRGLSALLSAQATRWSSTGDAPRAAQAEQLAAALVEESAARATRHIAEGAGHRLAEAVLAEEELTRCETALTRAEELHKDEQSHSRAHLNAMLSNHMFAIAATGLADPDLLTLAADRGERLLKRAPRHEPSPAELPAGYSPLALTPLRSPDSVQAYAAYCRARAAAWAGLEQQAQGSAEQALELAVRCEDFHALFATLILLRRTDEARLLIDDVEQYGALNAHVLARVRLFAGQAREAAQAAHGLDEWAQAFEGRPWELPGLKAEVAAANGDHTVALQLTEEAISRYEAHRTRLARDVLRSSLANDSSVMSLYHTAVLSHLTLDGVTREVTGACAGRAGARAAFAWAERSRSGFLDAVRALDAAQGPAEERAVRAWLRADSRWSAVYEDQVALLRRRASTGAADATTAVGTPSPDPAERRQRAEQELAEAEGVVRQAAPAALTAWRGTHDTTVEAVAESLPSGVLLLQYHLFDEDLVAWAITREGLRVVRTGQWAVAAAGLARRFHSWCSGLDRDPSTGPDLADLLLKPFTRELRDHQRVLLAPPPHLFLLPFVALPWEGGAFGDRRTLSYLPAASVLTRRPAGAAPSAAWSALLVGDPATDPAAQVDRLPGTAVEVHQLAALLPGAAELTGPRATLDAVAEAAAGRGILHLAAHGMVDELSPNRNHLVLAGRDKLSVGDLYGLHTDAGPELLVLSGCHTGRGTATAGGDVLGLARSALVAGARHAVVSLWPVDDRSGCLTMIRMYRHLAAARSHLPDGPGPGVAQALAEAQREVRALTAAEREAEYAALAAEAECPLPAGTGRGTVRDSGPATAPLLPPEHPFHWAPFIHIGTQEASA